MKRQDKEVIILGTITALTTGLGLIEPMTTGPTAQRPFFLAQWITYVILTVYTWRYITGSP